MARAPNEKVNKAYELYKSGMKLVEIASQLDTPASTIRRWKSTYKWDNERSVKKASVRKEVKQVLENTGLNDKQRLFCLYYIKYFNATKAYQKAYECSYETAMVEGSKSLRNPKLKDQILSLKQGKLNQVMLEPSDIFQKYMDIAFADITDFLDFGREEVPVMTPFGPLEVEDKETGEKTALMKEVNTVKFKESPNVDGTLISEVKQGKDGASIKLQDRMKALQWLSDHMDLATEEQKAKIALLKAKVNTDEEETTEDDGFIDALKGKVEDIWQE